MSYKADTDYPEVQPLLMEIANTEYKFEYLTKYCYKELLHDGQVFILATKLENEKAIRSNLENPDNGFHNEICFILDGKKIMGLYSSDTEVTDAVLECKQCYHMATNGM